MAAARSRAEPRSRIRVTGTGHAPSASICPDPNRPATRGTEARGAGARGHAPSLRVTAPETHRSGSGADGALGAPDLVFTQTVANLDVIGTQNIQGSVSVERNAGLLPDRQTAPAFIYQVPRVRTAAPAWPLLAYRQPLAMAGSLPALRGGAARPLQDCLAGFFAALLEIAPDSPAEQARPVRVAVSYAYALNEQQRQRAAATDPAALILTRIPLVLRATDEFVPARDLAAPEGMCPALANFLLEWADGHDVWGQGGSFCFDVTVYSNLNGSANPKPQIELPDVRLPLAEIARP